MMNSIMLYIKAYWFSVGFFFALKKIDFKKELTTKVPKIVKAKIVQMGASGVAACVSIAAQKDKTKATKKDSIFIIFLKNLFVKMNILFNLGDCYYTLH